MKKIIIPFLAFLLFATQVQAQQALPPGIEERFQTLEKEIQSLRKENIELRKAVGMENNTSAGQVLVRPSGKETSLKLGGLIQAQAEFGDKGDSRYSSDNDRFYLRRTRLNATGNFLEEFDFKVELDLSGTLTETSALRAQLTDAYINWNKFTFANIKAGQFKTPFGYEQLAKDPSLFTIERTLANDRLTLSRQVGAQINGDLFDKRVSYASGIFNGNGVNNNFNDDDNFMFVERLSAIPWQGKLFGQDSSWGVGGNVYNSHDKSAALNDFGFSSSTLTGRRFGAGGDTQFHIGRLDLWTEYLRGDYVPLNDVPSTHVDAQGGYFQAAYFVIPKKLQPVVKYDFFDPNSGTDDTNVNTWTLGLNYYIKGDDLKLQFNYLISDPTGQPDDTQDKFLVRVQTIF